MYFLFIHTSHMPSRNFTALTIQGHLHKSWSPSLRNVLNYHFFYLLYRSHSLLSTVHSHTCSLYHSFDVSDDLPQSVHKTSGKVICVIKPSRFLKGMRDNFQNEQQQAASWFTIFLTTSWTSFLGAIKKLQKATSSFVMSVCTSIRLTTRRP